MTSLGRLVDAVESGPVQREVTLHVLGDSDPRAGDPGAGDAAARALRQIEALTLADHEGVARVLDTVMAAAGDPRVVLERASGPVLRDWLARPSSLAERLDVFERVCDAVQHLHQRGLSDVGFDAANVVVVEHGRQRAAKLVAIGERTGRDPAGTARAMPHDDARGDARGDAREDVRRLGDLLVALDASLPRELRWIAARAAHEDPEQRYPSVAALAADIARFRRAEPVAAGPDRASYRLRKLIARHALLSVAALVIVAALGAGAVMTVLGFVDAREQGRRAEHALREARAAAERAAGNLGRFDVLETALRVAAAHREADALYPAWPRNEAPLAAFLARYADLRGQRPALREALARLLAAEPAATQAPAAPLRLFERAEIQEQRADLAAALVELREATHSRAAQRRAAVLDARCAEIDARLHAPGPETASASDDSARFVIRTLRELLDALTRFEERTWPSVERRLAWARSIEQRSLADAREAWTSATLSVRDADGSVAAAAYRGLALRPQLGLVPIGFDRRSKLLELAHLASGDIAQRDPHSGRLTIGDGTGIVFVLLPPGSFRIGAQRDDARAANYDALAEDHESPVHEVSLDAFLLAKHELTQGQWQRLSEGEVPSLYSFEHPSGDFRRTHPVERVSYDACEALLARHGLVLPTEAQWEYACRAGTGTPWATGASWQDLDGAVNLFDSAALRAGAQSTGDDGASLLDDGYAAHGPVDAFFANAFGLHSMHGNVSEWCADRVDSYTLGVRAGDGLRLVTRPRPQVVRGGSFRTEYRDTRSSVRRVRTRSMRDFDLGCRAARRLDGS